MTVQELRDLLADGHIDNDAEVFFESPDDMTVIVGVYMDDEGDCILSYADID